MGPDGRPKSPHLLGKATQPGLICVELGAVREDSREQRTHDEEGGGDVESRHDEWVYRCEHHGGYTAR